MGDVFVTKGRLHFLPSLSDSKVKALKRQLKDTLQRNSNIEIYPKLVFKPADLGVTKEVNKLIACLWHDPLLFHCWKQILLESPSPLPSLRTKSRFCHAGLLSQWQYCWLCCRGPSRHDRSTGSASACLYQWLRPKRGTDCCSSVLTVDLVPPNILQCSGRQTAAC